MPVHLYGQMAPVEEIADFARSHDLVVIEDAAQVQGAVRNGETYPATLGLAAGTSFYPGKNLGAYGDAGAVLTNSDDIARAVRALRNYGSETKYQHDRIGFNSRLDSLQAVVLNVKLKYLVEWNEARRAAAQRYMDMLEDLQDVTLPEVMNGNEHIWHLFVVRVQERDRVLKAMNADGIGAGVHYPVPLHLQPAFAGSGHEKGDFPVAERLADEVLSLPLFPEISEEQQRRVVDALARALRR
jgi:dTDP-4-amino-4,6-dideoxygalactose transaminase